MQTLVQQAQRVFEAHHGTLRTVEAQRAGIHPRTLYTLRDTGKIERLARGLYRLSILPAPGEPDLLTVAKKVPRAVFCLLSALAFHRLTTVAALRTYQARRKHDWQRGLEHARICRVENGMRPYLAAIV